jgi:hypothetical protein
VTEAEVEAINAEASVLMHRGMAFLEERRREAPIDALHCFDEALELRRRIPPDRSPFQAYLLAGSLLNRADALVRLNDAGPLAAALDSYEEAIDILRALPLDEDSRFPRRLALGHQNRALALQLRGDRSAAAAALASASAVLEDEVSAGISDRAHLRAVVSLNLANLLASDATRASERDARSAATRALALVADGEANDVHAAAVGLQARHVLCRLCVHSLAETPDDAPMPDEVHVATDSVDDGLELVRQWERKGVDAFRAFAVDLFRFGARVYARFQPQFLEEFINDNLDPQQSSDGYVHHPDMVFAAREAESLVRR